MSRSESLLRIGNFTTAALDTCESHELAALANQISGVIPAPWKSGTGGATRPWKITLTFEYLTKLDGWWTHLWEHIRMVVVVTVGTG